MSNTINIHFQVRQTSMGEYNARVPSEVILKGHEAVKTYLIDKSHVDSCLDYAERETKVVFDLPEIQRGIGEDS